MIKLKIFVAYAVALLIFAGTFSFNVKADDTWIPADVQSICEEVGERYNICPELLEAIIEHESSGQYNATNGNCKGLMQVNVKCHVDRMKKLGVYDIYDKKGNVLVATDYLCELFEEYGDPGTVLMVYNGVSNAVSRGNRGDYNYYAKSILKRSAELEREHGK